MKRHQDKEKPLPIWTRQDWAFIDNSIKKFVLAYPYHMDHIFELLEEKNAPQELKSKTLEIFLEQFKKEAETLLIKSGYSTDPEALIFIQNIAAIDRNISVDNACRVLLGIGWVRKAVRENNAKEAAIEMMRMIIAAFTASFYEVVIRGIRVKMASGRGGQKSKVNKALIPIIREALQKSKIKTATGLWNYIKLKYRADDFKSKDGTISFIDIDDPYWTRFKREGIFISKKKGSRGRYLDVTKETFIPFSTFKRYVGEAKRNNRAG